MAGNSFQSSSKKSSHPELCTALKTLRSAVQSNSSEKIDNALVVDLVSKLESEDHAICSTLDSDDYCTIVQILLKCRDYRDSERGIYLLGVRVCHLHNLFNANFNPGYIVLRSPCGI